MCIERRPGRTKGFTFVELIVFIVIVGVALAGVLTVLNHTTRHSSDPLLRKQALAIAEALLEEVTLQPFTWCDPDDPAAASATSTASCSAGLVENMGPETATGEPTTANGHLRGSGPNPWDNVNDYNGLTTTTNIANSGVAPFAATVSVVQNSLNGIPAAASLLVTVSVTAGSETIQLQGYRTRYSPNTLP
jgi:MSHA pilin protein MshD